MSYDPSKQINKKYLDNRLKYHTASRFGAQTGYSLAQALETDGHVLRNNKVWTASSNQFPMNSDSTTDPKLATWNLVAEFVAKGGQLYIVDKNNTRTKVTINIGANDPATKAGAETIYNLLTENTMYEAQNFPAVRLFYRQDMTGVQYSNGQSSSGNYQSYEIFGLTQRYKDWINPISILNLTEDQTLKGKPCAGYSGIAEIKQKNSTSWKVLQDISDYDLSYNNWQFIVLPGILSFAPEVAPKNTENTTEEPIKFTGFKYIGPTLDTTLSNLSGKVAADIAVVSGAVDSLSSSVSDAFGAGSKVVISKKDGITKSEVTVGSDTLSNNPLSTILATQLAVSKAITSKSIGVKTLNTLSDDITLFGSSAININNDDTNNKINVLLKINQSDKVLSQDNNGLLTNIKIQRNDTGKSETTAARYILVGKDNTQLGSAIDIPKDQFLSGAVYDDVSHELTLVMYLSGKTDSYTSTTINLSGLVDIYGAASGVASTMYNNIKTFIGVVNSKSESYLTVDKDGFKISGIDNLSTVLSSAITGVNKRIDNLSIVNSLNSLTGNINLISGSNISISKNNNNITIGLVQNPVINGKLTINGSLCNGISCNVDDGWAAHAEGNNTKAAGARSHAEGEGTYSFGATSHAEGFYTYANGTYSHTEGQHTSTFLQASHAEGYYTIASANYQHVAGKFNKIDSNAAYIIGNGDSQSDRKNAFVVDWNGNVTIAGNLFTNNNISGAAIYISGINLYNLITELSGNDISGVAFIKNTKTLLLNSYNNKSLTTTIDIDSGTSGITNLIGINAISTIVNNNTGYITLNLSGNTLLQSSSGLAVNLSTLSNMYVDKYNPVISGTLSTDNVYLNSISDDLLQQLEKISGAVEVIIPSGIYVTKTEASTISTVLSTAIQQNAGIKTLTGLSAINITGNNTSKTISLKIDGNDNVLSQSVNGLNTTFGIKKFTDGLSSTVAAEYAIVGLDGTTELGERITIYKDQFLSGAVYDESTKKLTLVVYLADGTTKQISMNLSGLISVYDAASGVSKNGSTFVGVVDGNSESYLTVSKDGFKLSGINDALSAVSTAITGSLSASTIPYSNTGYPALSTIQLALNQLLYKSFSCKWTEYPVSILYVGQQLPQPIFSWSYDGTYPNLIEQTFKFGTSTVISSIEPRTYTYPNILSTNTPSTFTFSLTGKNTEGKSATISYNIVAAYYDFYFIVDENSSIQSKTVEQLSRTTEKTNCTATNISKSHTFNCGDETPKYMYIMVPKNLYSTKDNIQIISATGKLNTHTLDCIKIIRKGVLDIEYNVFRILDSTSLGDKTYTINFKK